MLSILNMTNNGQFIQHQQILITIKVNLTKKQFHLQSTEKKIKPKIYNNKNVNTMIIMMRREGKI